MNAALHDISDPVFPHLATAFNPERMVEVLERALADRGDAPEILGAKISDVNYDPGQRCNLLFQFKVRRKGGGKTRRQMMTVRLLRDREHAPEEPGPEEIRRFQEAHGSYLPGPYFCAQMPRMVLCTFPYDPAMPWMAEGLDTTRMKHRLSRLWTPDRWKATKVKVSLLGYTPRMRASMHYEVSRSHRDSGTRQKVELIGKTNAFKKTGKLFADSWALWETSGKRFPMPRPVGYLGAPRLTLQEKVAGLRLGSMVVAAGFRDRVVETAEALALLHRLRFPVNARRRARDEVKSLTRWSDVVSRIRSDLGSRVAPFVAKISSEIESRTKALCAIHADFHHSNVLVDGDRIQVIDFDEMAYGDPAADVGRFLASLRIPTLRAFGDIHALDEVREQFLEAYLRQSAEDVSRIRLFEAASLVTSAASAFRIQRPSWDTEVSLLLDEAECTFAEARRSSFGLKGGAPPPDLSWRERIRWAGDPGYVHAMLDRPLSDALGVDADGCELLRREETRNGFKARFKLSGSRAGRRWETHVRVAVSKRRGGHTTYRLLEEHYPLLEQHPKALRPPRPLAYLHHISASVIESCPGQGLHAFEGIDRITEVMTQVGTALAAWHRASATPPGSGPGPDPAPARFPRRSRRSPAQARAAKIVAEAESVLPARSEEALLLLHNIRLHEVVVDSGQVGLVGVYALAPGDPRHDVAAIVAAWRLHGIATGEAESSAAAVSAFLKAYQEARGCTLESFLPFESIALAARAHHLRQDTPAMEQLLALAESQLNEL